jgi:hypothetical protein
VAPNGDIFIAESGAGRVRVLRPSDRGDEVNVNEIFASGLNLPFGIAFFPNGDNPQWVYMANTDSVVRFRYHNGDLKASTEPEVVVPILPHGGTHDSRDVAFSLDNTKMLFPSDPHPMPPNRRLIFRRRVNGSHSCVGGSKRGGLLATMNSSVPMSSCSIRTVRAGAFTRAAFAIAWAWR